VERSKIDNSEAITSIVLSCILLESFINESYEPIRYLPRTEILSGLVNYAQCMEMMVRDMNSIEEKYCMALKNFSEGHFDKGKNPYQNFAMLIKIRNDIVHNKAEVQITEFELNGESKSKNKIPKWVRHLITCGIIFESNSVENFIDLLGSEKVATWAFESSIEIIEHLISLVPNGKFRADLESFLI